MRKVHVLRHRDHGCPGLAAGKAPWLPLATGCALLLAAVSPSQAAQITWTNTGTSIVDETSISLNGNFVHAGKWGVASRTVTVGSESIFFGDATTQTVTPPVVGTQNAVVSANNEAVDANLFTGTVGADFKDVMSGAAYDGPVPKALVLNKLVVGALYQVQVFASDDRGCCSARTEKLSDAPTTGTGHETSTMSGAQSPTFVGTFTADAATQTVYILGVAQTQTVINAYILRELVGPDSDGDGLPDYWEALYTSPSSTTSLTPGADADGDGLSNLVEFQKHTNPNVLDTDGDNLSDGAEVNTYHSDPLLLDTDGDTINDDVEVNTYHTSPTNADSDNDGFADNAEINAVPPTNPTSNADNPAHVTASKRGLNNLIGGDVTDPENDGNGTATAAGTGFNWDEITSSVAGASFTAEGVYSIFDNQVGVTGSKWFATSVATPPWVRTKFNTPTALTGVTLTSGNDAPERDPVNWEIQGSLDGTTFTTIFKWQSAYGAPWSAAERNSTYSITFPKKTYPYLYYRFQVFNVRGNTATPGTGNFQLDELELIGETNGADSDSDNIPDLVEDFYPFLNKNDGNDGFADYDNDGLVNYQEYEMKTKMDVADSDGDGLNDGKEVNDLGTLPLVADTDGDGLTDGQEAGVGGYGTDPKIKDTDGDGFFDGEEVKSTPPTDPKDANSRPYKVTILGTGTAALLKHDLTDPEDNINDDVGASTTTNNQGANFNWVSLTTNSTKNFFNGVSQTNNTTANSEGFRNIFDNKVGGGETKWCCEVATAAAPKLFTLEFAAPVSLAYFTMAAGGDSLDRSPTEWVLSGSNDGTTFTTIVADTSPGTHFFTAVEQVIRFDLNAPAPPYKFIRFSITGSAAINNPQTNAVQFSEIEFFTASEPKLPVTQQGFNISGGYDITVGNLDTTKSYQLYRSTTLLANSWTAIGSPITPAATTQIFNDPTPPLSKALYRVKSVP